MLWPKQIRQKFKSVEDMAEFCFPDGSVIECLKCEINRSCSVEEIAEWMKNGYPKCKKCNHRTTLRNPHIKRINID